MSTLERNRVFDTPALEEFQQAGTAVLDQAETISSQLASELTALGALCGRVPSGAKEMGLGRRAEQTRQTIIAQDYQTTRQRIVTSISQLQQDIYPADQTAGDSQQESGQTAARVSTMIQGLSDLLDDGILNLPYQDYVETINGYQKELQEQVLDIEDRLRQAEDTMCGLQSYAAVYSPDPVHLATGSLYYQTQTLLIPGETALHLTLSYNSISRRKGALLRGWSHSYQTSLREKEDIPVLDWEDGARYYFTIQRNNTYTTHHPGLTLRKTTGAWLLFKDEPNRQSTYTFTPEGTLRTIEENGETITITRDPEDRIHTILTAHGDGFFLTYHPDGTLHTIQDHSGRTTTLSYEGGRLRAVHSPMGTSETYTYAENGKLKTITSHRGTTILKNTYDTRRRIIRQDYPDGGTQTYTYLDWENKVSFQETDGSQTHYIHDSQMRHQTTKGPQGTRRFRYNQTGQLTASTAEDGTTTRYTYRPDGTLETTDPMGNKETISYDPARNQIRLRHKDGETTRLGYTPRETYRPIPPPWDAPTRQTTMKKAVSPPSASPTEPPDRQTTMKKAESPPSAFPEENTTSTATTP